MIWDPHPDVDAAGSLGTALRAVGYTTDAIEELLGEDGPSTDLAESVVFERRLPSSPLATTIRLLLLERPVRRGDAFSALGDDGARALVVLGLVTERADVLVPRARIVPVEGLLLTFDGFSRGEHDQPGWVSSFSPTAYWLASVTPRRPVGRALDIGTGNGAHALLAASHAERVVATDVNPRALAFTAISAALNGIGNVETRLGSLFEPVSGETFDLITCNAPYVVSPESRWQYRDGGLPGDQLSERVVRESPRHLAPGGHASVLVSWLARSPDEPDERLDEWLDGNDCDAWVLGLSGADPLDHAAGWNEHLGIDPDAYGRTLDEWTGYFEALDAHWISEGAVLMRQREGDHHIIRADTVDEDDLEFAGDQIERVFAGLAFLAESGEDALLHVRLRLAPDVRFVEELDGDGGVREIRIALDEGTCPELEIEPDLADLLIALDGRITLDAAAARPALRRRAVSVCRELLEQGFLDLV